MPDLSSRIKVTRFQFLLGIIVLFFCIASVICGVNGMFALVLGIWAFAMLFAVGNLKNRSLFFVFLISYFVFLLGGHVCYEYAGMDISFYFSDEYYFHSNLCLFLSILFIIFGYIVVECTNISFGIRTHSKDIIDHTTNSGYVESIKKVSRMLYYVTFPFWIYTIMDRISFVLANSYSAYYTDYESSAPYAIRAVAALTPYFFYLFLSTFPSKKECRFPFILYLVYAGISLLTGRRVYFMTMVLFAFLYILVRHFKDNNEVWIKRKYVIIAVIVVPLLVLLLQIVRYTRMGETASDISVIDLLLGFFQEQGYSSCIIRLEKFYESSLRSDALYSFYGIVRYFRTNTVIKLLFNPQYDFSYYGHTVANATRSNNMANALSYLTLSSYLSGAGTGTCYIAELYHDFGYAGVACGSLVYGIVMGTITKIWNSKNHIGIWTCAIGFAMVESFLKAPRWNYDIFIAYFLDMAMWIAFAMVFVISHLRRKT